MSHPSARKRTAGDDFVNLHAKVDQNATAQADSEIGGGEGQVKPAQNHSSCYQDYFKHPGFQRVILIA